MSFKGKEDLVGTYYNKEFASKIKYGMSVKVKGELYKYSHNTIPNTFDYNVYLLNKGINYGIKINNVEIIDENINIIYRIKNYIYERIIKIDDTGFMMAFILGDKSYLDKDVYKCFQRIGTSHLLALSGMHISLLTGIILKLLKRIDDKIKYIICSIILIIYGFLVLYPASILRCIIFFILSSINKIFKLELSNIRILYLTAFIILLINIMYVYDIGFWYSFGSVFGILFCHDFINGKYSYIKLSIVTFLFTLPLSLYSFYSINVLSIIYNLFYIPFVSLIVYPLSLITFFVPGLYNVLRIFLNILISITNYLASIRIFEIHLSFNILEIIIYYIFLIISIYFKKNIFLLGTLLVVLIDLLIPYFDKNAYVYFFDVGQGDSSLIVLPYRKEVIMIDTGGIAGSEYKVSDNVITFLYSLGINDINLILTHGDYDHMGETTNIINNINVKKVIFNCGEYNDLEIDLIKLLDLKGINYYSCIKELKFENNKLYFLQTKELDNENDNSNVIITELNGYNFLFMGDAGSIREKDIINKYNISVDILKVGHHGSKTSSSIDFINEINPKYSIISVGKNNRYGHPNKEVLENLENSKIYRTDKDGSIMFQIKNNKLKIETCSP